MYFLVKFDLCVLPKWLERVNDRWYQKLLAILKQTSQARLSPDAVLDGRKRTCDDDNVGTNSRGVNCLPIVASTLRGVHAGSPVSSIATSSTEGGESINGKRHKNPADRNLRMVDKVMKLRDAFHLLKFFLILLRHRASFANGKIMSGPYIA